MREMRIFCSFKTGLAGVDLPAVYFDDDGGGGGSGGGGGGGGDGGGGDGDDSCGASPVVGLCFDEPEDIASALCRALLEADEVY